MRPYGSIAAVSLLALAGCTLAKPAVTVTGVHVTAMDFSQATLDVRLHVENPNPIPVSCSSLGYEIDIGGKKLVRGTLPEGITLNAAGGSDVDLPLVIRYADALGGLAQALARKSIHYKLAADVGFSARLAAVTVPIQAEGDLPMPVPPLVRPLAVRVASAGLGGLDLAIDLAIDNPNGFGVKLDDVSSTFTLAGVPLAQSTLGPLALAASGSARTTLDLSIPPGAMIALVQALRSASASGAIPYAWQGNVVIDGYPLGASTTGTLPAPALPGL